MTGHTYIQPFTVDEFEFEGAFCFNGSSSSFLLSKQGTSLIISNDQLKHFNDGIYSEDLIFKLYQRGFGKVYGKERFSVDCCTPNPTFFMIDFTSKCNCSCIYCLRHFEDTGSSVSWGTLSSIVDYIISYCQKYSLREISFQPWGGEPLIELDKILWCKKKFDNSGIAVKFNIQTNGLLLTLPVYELLEKNNIDVGISIDGIQSVHDFHRLDVSGDKTHAKIVNNIHTILQKHPDAKMGILCVNSSYSLEYIDDNVNYFVNELGINHIKFNLLHPSGSDNFDYNLLISVDDVEKYIQDLLSSIIRSYEHGVPCYEANIVDRLLNLIGRQNNNICNASGCRGGFSFISFDQHGNIYPCEMIGEDRFCIGNIYDEKDLVNLIGESVQHNPYYSTRNLETCSNCPYLFYCRGGCKACSLSYGRDASDIDTIECMLNRCLYPALISLILERPRLVEKMLDYRVTFG